MNQTFDANERQAQRHGFKLFGVAGGAAIGVLALALNTPGAHDNAAVAAVDTAPAADERVTAPTQRHGALDEGVDWQSVPMADPMDGASVAAYERVER